LKRRLILLDLALVALIALAGWRVRQNWQEAQKREQLVLRAPQKRPASPSLAPLPALEPVNAAAYAAVAQKMLFASDRNPTVVVEAAPPKPVPALPVLHGIVNVGDGLTAIMSLKSEAPHRGYRPGETVGEFKLVSLSHEEIVLEWEGRELKKKVEELMERRTAAASADSSETTPRVASAPSAATVISSVSQPAGTPGERIRSCDPNDNSAPGTVKDGYRKVVKDTPFGRQCRWELMQ
jgi:hypothetical protein